ncbi:hypothetical protein GCM10025868_03340 [Angustibacter aerolatus]|uniref:FUSC family protein n=1 Tax=Angustibacter aerolatus TaxID=1162965 RepID=A0ABQ6JD14_9ACTN|nr:hypothetical protein GCM10025868_03340 [Angustibacter aerolatus]
MAVAMTIAVLLDAGPLMTTQAGVQSAIILALAPPSASYGLGRWEDAVCGGVTALAVAALAPGTPLRRPREAAGRALDELSGWLTDAARAVREGDVEPGVPHPGAGPGERRARRRRPRHRGRRVERRAVVAVPPQAPRRRAGRRAGSPTRSTAVCATPACCCGG